MSWLGRLFERRPPPEPERPPVADPKPISPRSKALARRLAQADDAIRECLNRRERAAPMVDLLRYRDTLLDAQDGVG